ncbi:MAG: carboxypeptidase regulatory-like domain-containing protein [Isosphaerales bacterium]
MSASPSLRFPDIRPRTHAGAARVTIVVLGLIGLACGFPRRCAAQAEDLSGRVVDKAGIGVSGAKVWAIGGDWETPETIATATTGDRGYFVFPRAWGPAGPQVSRFLNVFARVGDGRIGWRGSVWWHHVVARELTIVLGQVGQVRGRLNDQDGQTIAGAEVMPVSFSRSAEEHPGQDMLRLSDELARPLRTKTAADGSFALDGIPPGSQVDATIAAPGFGKPGISWDASRPVSIVLDGRLGRIEGRLKPPGDRKVSGTLSVSLRRKTSREDRASAPFQVFYSQTVSADHDRAFRFDDVPPGRYEVFPVLGRDSRAETDGAQEVEVGPKAVARVGMSVQWPVTITGRILDAQTGKGIAGIGLRSTLLSYQNSLQSIGQAQTDAGGHYTIEARHGKVQVQPNAIPKTYLGLWSRECPRLEVTADRTWPDLKLARATDLDGVVVDAAGQPVVGAEVVVTAPDPRGFGSGGAWTRSGPGGTFHLEQLDPDDTLPLRARTKEATTDGVIVITPRTVAGKLAITIDPKFAFRIRGLATDRSGKRIAGARVQLRWTRHYVSGKPEARGKGIGGALESYTTSEAGWFVFRDLWPGDRYQVVIEAPGRGKVETPEVIGKAGETHDFGTIVLTGFDGHLAGRVAGSDGWPIAGATVCNRGDGPRPVEALTDNQGRFRLESLFPGTKYAFVRKDGYRFTGMEAHSDVDDLTITLLKMTEPPPAWKPAATASFEDQRAFARRILVRLWAKFGENAEQNGASSCILNMARIDPELALQWSADHGRRYDGQVRQAAAEMLAELDGPEALAMLTPADPSESQYTLQRLADRFAPTDPKKALLFAEEAVVLGRALNQPGRAAALSRAGTVLAQLGRAEAGRKLIEEAAEAANRMGTEVMEGYTRGVVAKALTPFDANRALALLEPFHGNDLYAGFVAASLAEKDPARAVALADAMAGNGPYPDRARTEVASRIGADRPDEAIRIIEGMKSFAADYMRAEAFAWLAIAVAPRDRPRAFALIDRALASPVDRPRLYESWINSGGGTASAAHMAAAARRVDYPDMHSVIMRVMTTRPITSGPRAFDPGMQIRSATMAAVPLALVDPGAARVLLQQLEARSGLDPDKLTEVAGRDWLRAWALVDLKKAETLFEAQLTAIEGTKDVKLQNTGFFRMIEILALPPHRRAEEVFHMDATGRPVFPY